MDNENLPVADSTIVMIFEKGQFRSIMLSVLCPHCARRYGASFDVGSEKVKQCYLCGRPYRIELEEKDIDNFSSQVTLFGE